jgi:rod shape-determining protein MreC
VLGQVQTAGRNAGRSDVVTAIVQSFVAPPASVVSRGLSNTEQFLEGVRDANMLRRENDRLEAELRAMGMYKVTLDRMQTQVDSLRAMANFLPPAGRTKVYANIIGYSPAQNSLTIDRGSDDGIQKFQPVVGAKGLVGIIEVADPKRSRVLLVTARSIRVTASIVAEPNVTGIVHGETRKRLAMDLFDDPDTIAVGAPVLTSGFSELTPAGIPLGIVVEVVNDPQHGTKRVFILPHLEIGELSEVFVLK